MTTKNNRLNYAQHLDIIKKYNIKIGYEWNKFFIEHRNEGWYAAPWRVLSKTTSLKFFTEIWGKIRKTEQDHYDLINEHKIKNSSSWYDFYKKNNLRSEGYYSQPWIKFALFPYDMFGKHLDPIKKKYKKMIFGLCQVRKRAMIDKIGELYLCKIRELELLFYRMII